VVVPQEYLEPDRYLGEVFQDIEGEGPVQHRISKYHLLFLFVQIPVCVRNNSLLSKLQLSPPLPNTVKYIRAQILLGCYLLHQRQRPQPI
jgi:hypothetical protein